jgi:hypothetical protein
VGRASRGRRLEDLERAVEAEWGSGWESKGEDSLLSTALGQARREGLRGAREAWGGEEGWEEARWDGAPSPTPREEEARRREQSAALSPNRH